MLVGLYLTVRSPSWTRFSNGLSVQQLLFSHKKKRKKFLSLKLSVVRIAGTLQRNSSHFWSAWKRIELSGKSNFLLRGVNAWEKWKLSSCSSILFGVMYSMCVCVYFNSDILNIWYFVALAFGMLCQTKGTQNQRKLIHLFQGKAPLISCREHQWLDKISCNFKHSSSYTVL